MNYVLDGQDYDEVRKRTNNCVRWPWLPELAPSGPVHLSANHALLRALYPLLSFQSKSLFVRQDHASLSL
jgi:hypothetical protein